MIEFDWMTVAEIVGVIVGLVGAIKILWIVGKWLKKKWNEMFSNTIINQKIDNLTDAVEDLRERTVGNSGNSMIDKLDRLEHSIALTSERQRARMLDSDELVYETDTEGNCTWVNRTYARAVERGYDELMGRGWVNVIAESNRDSVEDKWYESIEQDREFEMKVIYATPEGTEFPVMVRSYKMKHNGETIGYLGTVTLL